jgi:hypothetical protein
VSLVLWGKETLEKGHLKRKGSKRKGRKRRKRRKALE